MASDKIIRIGGASGFWGESDMAVPQFLKAGGLDYIVFDYLAEITMSIMARARAKDPNLGYATDFVSAVIKPHINEIAKQGVKLISNAGGTNPKACGDAVRTIVAETGLDLKVAVITGDDLSDRASDFAQAREMFSGDTFPEIDSIASINAYLGAFPIAKALDEGADIVITGRCVDSAVTLGACIHEFGWSRDDLGQLAGASLAGHILECGPQATGGNFTDWESVADSMDEAGYPIAEITADGNFVTTKPGGTGGIVNIGTVGEQMLYEIGDPQAYMLARCNLRFQCCFARTGRATIVSLCRAQEDMQHRIHTKPAPPIPMAGKWSHHSFSSARMPAARRKSFAENALKRTRKKLRASNAGDFDEVLIETVGDDSHLWRIRQGHRFARGVSENGRQTS